MGFESIGEVCCRVSWRVQPGKRDFVEIPFDLSRLRVELFGQASTKINPFNVSGAFPNPQPVVERVARKLITTPPTSFEFIWSAFWPTGNNSARKELAGMRYDYAKVANGLEIVNCGKRAVFVTGHRNDTLPS